MKMVFRPSSPGKEKSWLRPCYVLGAWRNNQFELDPKSTVWNKGLHHEALPVVVRGKCLEEMPETNSNAMGGGEF